MKWYEKLVMAALVLMAGYVLTCFAQDYAQVSAQRVVCSQINAYGPHPIQIMGTNMTATAAQLNAAGGGTTAAITPTTATVATTLTASKKFVQTGDTLTVTEGAVLLTPTNNTIYVAGQYGVVNMSVAAATFEGTIRIINTIATNIVFVESNGLQLPAGYSAITNGQYDVLTLTSQGTNWICTGWQDN